MDLKGGERALARTQGHRERDHRKGMMFTAIGYRRGSLPATLVVCCLLLLVAEGSVRAQLPAPVGPPEDRVSREEEEEIRTVRVDSLIEVGLSPGRPLVRANAWSPVSVTLANLGIEFDGYVEMRFIHRGTEAVDPRRYRRKYWLPVSLPKRIKGQDPPTKRYTLPVFFEEGDAELWVNLSVSGRGWLGGGKYLELGRTPLHIVEPEDRLILAVSGAPDQHSHLSFSFEGLPRWRVVDTRPDRLPDLWACYTGADAVLLDTRGLLDVSPASLEALMSYVASGGRLIVCGGSAHATLQREPWSEILPVRVTGFGMLESSGALVERFSPGYPLAGAVMVSTGTVQGGEVLLTEGTIPLIVRRSHGLGSVYYAAFNLNTPAIQRWVGRYALARPLFTSSREPLLLERPAEDAEKQIELSLLTRQLVDLPPRMMVGIFLIVYVLAAVPVNYFFLRRTGRREWVWATLPLLAAIFSLGIFAYNRFTHTQRMNFAALTLLEMESGSPYARGRTFWSVYSPSRTSLETWFDDEVTLPSEPLYGEREREMVMEAEPIEFTWGSTLRVSRLPIRHQSNRMFASSGIYDVSGTIIGDLVFDGVRTISGTVENRTPIHLHNCYLVSGSRCRKLDDLAPGNSVEVRLHIEEDFASIDYAGFSFPGAGEETDGGASWVPERAWDLGLPLVREKSGLYLVGLSAGAPIHPSSKNKVATSSEGTFVVVSLPVRLERREGISEVPVPFVSRITCRMDAFVPPEPGRLLTLGSGEWVTFAFRPAGMDLRGSRFTRFGLKVDMATLRVTAYNQEEGRPAKSGEVNVQLYNRWAHRWDDFPAMGGIEYLDQLEPYLDQDAPEVLVRVIVPEKEQREATVEYGLNDISARFLVKSGGEDEFL